MSSTIARFQKELVYRSEASAASVLGDLDRIAAFDVENERQQSKWKTVTIVAVIIGLVAVIVAGINELPALAAVLGLVAAAVFVYALLAYLRHRKSNVDNRRHVLPSRLLGLLAVDLARQEPVSIEIDFRPVRHDAKLAGKGRAGPWSVAYYRDPWLQVSGRFADGTTFRLVKTDLLQVRSRTKRSASGKTKHKSKTKVGFDADLRLCFKPEKYRHMGKLQADAGSAIQLPDGVEQKRLRYGDREIGLRAAAKRSWGVAEKGKAAVTIGSGIDGTHVLALMFLSLFQVLNLSKAIDKSSASGGAA